MSQEHMTVNIFSNISNMYCYMASYTVCIVHLKKVDALSENNQSLNFDFFSHVPT
jgi:hypothetical protein